MRHHFLNQWRLPVFAFMAAMVFGLSSCSDDDGGTNPAPTLTLASATAANAPGNKVSATVTVDAPAGGKTLKFLVNGVADSSLPDVALKGETTESVTSEYTIPANASVGSTINISVQAVDKNDQTSASSILVVTVTSVPTKQVVEVAAGNITTDTHWTADKVYHLNGFVRIGKDEKVNGGATPEITGTATLTIDAGTVIMGAKGTPGGTLVIQRGSKIIANGTKDAPVVFTSDQTANRKPGDWGGVVICGKAVNNTIGGSGTNGVIELEGGYGAWHGGTDDADNSGVLKYVRIEYAGYPINPNQEINGLTFGSVGTGTTVDNVQVSYSNDDSFEWFGGSVNATHLISYKALDDDFDTDNGFRGKVQFGLAIRDALVADQSGSNGFESDNDANGTANTPFTQPVFSNMTIIGGKQVSNTTISLQFQNGAHIRRSSKISIINSFITGFPTGIFIDGTAGTSLTSAANGDLQLKNIVLAGVSGWGGNSFGTAANTDEQAALSVAAGSNHANAPRGRVFAAGTIASGSNPFQNGVFTVTDAQIGGANGLPWFLDGKSNAVLTSWADAKLGVNASIFEPLNGTPTVLPTGASLTSGGSFAGFTGFDTSATYIGAFKSTDWTADWVNWTPANTDYSK